MLVYDTLNGKRKSAKGWVSKLNLFKKLFGIDIENHKWLKKVNNRIEIRNDLAHDITSVTISEDHNYIDNGKTRNIYIKDIFDILKNCAAEINNLKLDAK